MGKIVRTRQARSDALDIWNHIADDNEAAADKLILQFNETLALLAEQPRLGSSQEELRKGLRCMPVRSYLVFYEPIPGGIRVFRILHSARR